MVKNGQEFAPLDNVLMLAGCRINVSNRGYRIANCIFRLLILASYAFTCFAQVVVNNMPQEPQTFLFYADAIFGTIFMITMIRKRAALQTILTQVYFPSDSQRIGLRNHSRDFFFFILLFFLKSFVLLSIHLWCGEWWCIVVDTGRTYMVCNS